MMIIMKSVIKMMRKKMQNGSRGKYQDTEGKLCQSKYIYIFFPSWQYWHIDTPLILSNVLEAWYNCTIGWGYESVQCTKKRCINKYNQSRDWAKFADIHGNNWPPNISNV